jgi:hypothetical protein
MQKRASRLAYTPEFKQLVRQNPGAIREFLEAHKRGAEEASFSGISIRKIETDGFNHKSTWKVEAGSKAFFVKETGPSALMGNDGFSQYSLMTELIPVLHEKFKGIEVGRCHLGYIGGKMSFLVMNFYDLPKVNEIRLDVWKSAEWKGFGKLFNLLLEAKKYLWHEHRVWDVRSENTFYDRDRGWLVIFDPVKNRDF